MKIKRTKTGTKTSDSKHEIVKSDHNGIISSDESVGSSKKIPNAMNIPSSPSSSNKRGNNSHKKEKVISSSCQKLDWSLIRCLSLQSKDKSGSKEKLDTIMNQSDIPCGCGSEKVSNLASTPCNSTNCIKLKDAAVSNRIGSSNHSSSSR